MTDGQHALRPAVFIDRDGTLNHDCGYLYKFENFRWIDMVPEALAILKKAGFALVVVTNQSGVARNFYSERDVAVLHAEIDRNLMDHQRLTMDGWYYCPHDPNVESCACRKPAPGMLFRAASELSLDLARSYMVGDKLLDIKAGLAAGVKQAILVLTGYGQEEQKNVPPGIAVVDSFPQAADLIVSNFALSGS
jgi:D-glycero-D-manno-heptose 1,7-bisphosphate phosphatase